MAIDKLGQDAFLYLNPLSGVDEFAQCFTCRDWIQDGHCYIHGPEVEVPDTASCGLYVHGESYPTGSTTYKIVTPEESGLVDREVRCENCVYGGEEVYTCELFSMLNQTMPDIFDIVIAIEPGGCCNAQTPRD